MAAADTVAHGGFASDAARRKRLGQYFTGLPPARLLAALAQTHEAETVIDPMVGSGDMLLGALSHGRPRVLGGIEIDPAALAECASRLQEARVERDALVLGSAFAPTSLRALPTRAWDAVITNPPYVRYQSTSQAAGTGLAIPSGSQIRRDLLSAIEDLDALDDEDKRLFGRLAHGYSGLADLAVPSWILCAGLVRVGGTLAMLVPSTWLSRDYAHPVRYLLDRWFDVTCVVEDGDATWFRDALVRTTLVVATRVPRRTSAFTAEPRDGHVHVRLTADMATDRSLVARLFPDHADPDLAFTRALLEWKAAAKAPTDDAVDACWVPAAAERLNLSRTAGSDTWLRDMGEGGSNGETDVTALRSHPALAARVGAASRGYVTLNELGWRAGQGLRTGANRFFYVDVVVDDAGAHRVIVNPFLGREAFDVSASYVLPVLRRQTELPAGFAVTPDHLPGRVLVLHEVALPEDLAELPAPPYAPLSDPLAAHVRSAALVNIGTEAEPRFIPQLSAVAPNARRYDSKRPEREARFWYQLPPLTERHRPSLLVARINNGHPRTFLNARRASVIDANFSTLWPSRDTVATAHALLAMLNSALCVAEMELRGTVLGGGALKLEAAHLRRLPLPALGERDWAHLDALGSRLASGMPADEASDVLGEIDECVFAAAGVQAPSRAAHHAREIALEWLHRRSK